MKVSNTSIYISTMSIISTLIQAMKGHRHTAIGTNICHSRTVTRICRTCIIVTDTSPKAQCP